MNDSSLRFINTCKEKVKRNEKLILPFAKILKKQPKNLSRGHKLLKVEIKIKRCEINNYQL